MQNRFDTYCCIRVTFDLLMDPYFCFKNEAMWWVTVLKQKWTILFNIHKWPHVIKSSWPAAVQLFFFFFFLSSLFLRKWNVFLRFTLNLNRNHPWYEQSQMIANLLAFKKLDNVSNMSILPWYPGLTSLGTTLYFSGTLSHIHTW